MYRRWTQNLWTTFALVFYCCLLGRLFFIQVIQKGKYQSSAERQSQKKIILLPERGIIYDRNFNTLARDINQFSFGVDPDQLNDKRFVAKTFSNATGNGIHFYETLLKKDKFVWLARGMDQKMSGPLKFNRANPVTKVTEKGRFYPYQNAAANVIGFTNVDNDGLAGVEKTYDQLLKGEEGYKIIQIDAQRKFVPIIHDPEKPPKDGKSIVLTLDIEYQLIAEEELKRGVEKYGSKAGMVVMMDPSNGEVLAMVSYPSFNPNNYSSYSKSEQRNRTLVDPYEPGSTFKLVAAAAAYQDGIYNPTEKIDCENGKKRFPGGYIRDHKPYDRLTFKEVFAKSSNIGFAKIAQKITKKRMYKYGRAFGFGSSTGIDLIGEDRGKFTNPVHWSESDVVRFPLGYGVLTTAMQLTNAYAVVANGGYLLKPKIVKAVLSENHPNLIEETKPDTIRQVLIPETVSKLKSFMHEVVRSGTGKSAAIEGVEIAGKTGTTKKYDPVLKKYSDRKYIASFIGITPIEKPKIVCLVVMDEPEYKYKYGQQSAAPIFRNIIMRIQSSIQEPKNDLKKIISDQKNKKQNVQMPDVLDLNIYQAKTVLTDYQFQIRMDGNGNYIKNQHPKPGSFLNSGEVVKLVLGERKNNSKPSNKVPNVVGKSIRDAIEILTQAGYDPIPKGSGYVIEQIPKPNVQSKNRKCKIVCQPVSE